MIRLFCFLFIGISAAPYPDDCTSRTSSKWHHQVCATGRWRHVENLRSSRRVAGRIIQGRRTRRRTVVRRSTRRRHVSDRHRTTPSGRRRGGRVPPDDDDDGGVRRAHGTWWYYILSTLKSIITNNKNTLQVYYTTSRTRVCDSRVHIRARETVSFSMAYKYRTVYNVYLIFLRYMYEYIINVCMYITS